jgi:hypothetical protein
VDGFVVVSVSDLAGRGPAGYNDAAHAMPPSDDAVRLAAFGLLRGHFSAMTMGG